MPNVRPVLLVALATLTMSAFADDAGVTTTRAEVTKRAAPTYPMTALSRGEEGWVKLSYVITPEGKVVDPVVQDSSGNQRMEQEAKKALRKWRYKPAVVDGEPVQQCVNESVMVFAIEGRGAKSSFRKMLFDTSDLIEAGELDEAERRVNEAFEKRQYTLNENAWLWSLRASIHGARGDKKAQLAAIQKATAYKSSMVPVETRSNWLLVKSALEFELGRLSSGIRTYRQLQEIDESGEIVAKIAPYVEQVEAQMATDTMFYVDAIIGLDGECESCTESWHYKPLRRTISLTDVQGELGDLELRCDSYRYTDKARADTSWSIPESWGDCTLIVFGEAGAQFRLIEQPPSASETT